MAQTHKKLWSPNRPTAGAAAATVYTVGGATKAQLYSIAITNVGSTPVVARLHLVPSGSSALIGNALYYDIQIPGRDTFVANIAEILETGDFVAVYSDNGNAVFHGSGIEIT